VYAASRQARTETRRFMRSRFAAAVAVTAVVGAIAVASSWAGADESMTRTQADAILSELSQIRMLLERLTSAPAPGSAGSAPAPGRAVPDERVKVGVGTLPALGRNDAPVIIVEFADYQCPFCQRFHLTAFEEVKRNFVDTGKVRYVSRDLPLAMHPNAMSAAHAARCAGEQNKFWEMRHRLIVNASQLGMDRYNALADELKLDRTRFDKCLAEERYKADIVKDMSDAAAAGVTGTPTFVIGRAVGDGIEGARVVGALPYSMFDAKLKDLLAGR
jgi:protein-disulfide isomerase